MTFCFIASDKLEPVVIVVAVDHRIGRLLSFPSHKIDSLESALKDFCAWTQTIDWANTQFTYTDYPTRVKSHKHNMRCHSMHFHLKLHIDHNLYGALFPAFQFTYVAAPNDADQFSDADQFQYVRRLKKMSWADTRRKLMQDCEGGHGTVLNVEKKTDE
jgi:hypothetical protein